MSGGSYNYAYSRIYELADEIRSSENPEADMLRRGFSVLLRKVATAMHMIEWVDSSDAARGDEIESLKVVVNPADILAGAVAEAKVAHDRLAAALNYIATLTGK